jgi:isoamylase
MGVDGFRFDLAAVLGETDRGFDAAAPFFQAIAQDPLLSRIKLIAEPWHVGVHGYRLGQFPGAWLEWNDKFRDATRRFWLRHDVPRGEFARRFLASADMFHKRNRMPTASVNYVCAHDGLTLWDAVAYNHKHNEANGESNRDGRDGEISHNHGTEGSSDDLQVIQQRQQSARVLLANLLLAQGTPMLRGGDEILQTQRGNNNAYCQDNETSWLDWSAANLEIQGFVRRLLEVRKRYPLLRHNAWFARAPDAAHASVQWFNPQGHALHASAWEDAHEHALAALFAPAKSAQKSAPQMLWFGINPGAQEIEFVLPSGAWLVAIDCAQPTAQPTQVHGQLKLAGRNLILLAQVES